MPPIPLFPLAEIQFTIHKKVPKIFPLFSAANTAAKSSMSESEQRLRRGRNQPHLSKQSTVRDVAWTNRRRNNLQRRGHSVTDDDLDELRACFELGFNFDSPDLDPKLSSAFPALEFYHAVNRRYSNTLSRSSSLSLSDSDSTSGCVEANTSIIDPSEDPEVVKTRLKQWAQVVACSVRQFSPN